MSMTPRTSKDLAGSHRGLSAHVNQLGAITSGKTGKHTLQEIDVALLRQLQAFVDDETGHVSIRPATDEQLREWAESRGSEGESHVMTLEVQSAIIDQVELYQ